MDPIIEDELKRSRIMKQYQQYQNNLDQIENVGVKDTYEPCGEMQGKTVKKISSDQSQANAIFRNSIRN